jgi:hypothetical protein
MDATGCRGSSFVTPKAYYDPLGAGFGGPPKMLATRRFSFAARSFSA